MTTTAAGDTHATLAFDGVLFFPVTPFTPAGEVDVDVLTAHVAGGVEHGAGGVFVACGTGEFHALSLGEYEQVVRAGVAAVAGRVPVIAGVGGAIGQAAEMIRIAESAGADGFLLLPPYLVNGPQDGVARYIEEIAARTSLPVIAYHRGQGALTLATVERLLALPNLAGIKDGVGDVALMQQFVAAARRRGRDDLQFFNGLLTAEASQASYTAIGVPLYSSAAFAMAPEIASRFYAAHRDGDAATQARLLDEFYTPLIRLRDTTPGFGVALIKAGLAASGVAVGGVRAPLSDPTPEQVEELAAILAHGRKLVSA
ncbi:5-dehydro-4-deoxyglucarate dehydratase [Microbacterium excoecariae]|uniref:5-dehydro-4-deoxyglucarate dehydratase n=1 Tax=Microbacterium excoecariae TaxID=2715210 RepID=UPI001409E989|nr:5-dehydro-4-deoxyglucarate dehydratase [Microbacterium excoecariae]NHI16550.1 5-dehydro-4-deoxyglucarate dehydratase [Microbacterium excoecariae]